MSQIENDCYVLAASKDRERYDKEMAALSKESEETTKDDPEANPDENPDTIAEDLTNNLVDKLVDKLGDHIWGKLPMMHTPVYYKFVGNLHGHESWYFSQRCPVGCVALPVTRFPFSAHKS
eukprot:gnl/MRDRNA2_/MRDRNA2_330389_c0_seq1.p1 gnl/MRDRNA2_/MRDRNA2_330389_c0~~gnl/MRDRNA2_/MRDRNA2_330389_c0_seq1.p1  ORF type:complete len:121 (-),score=16.19 gnl/MRDRNA2_/MRDRNA2_330389_c0_seq1:71-433(-)